VAPLVHRWTRLDFVRTQPEDVDINKTKNKDN